MFDWFWNLFSSKKEIVQKEIDFCNECGGELDEDGDCLDCDYLEDEEDEDEEGSSEPTLYSPFHDVFYDAFKEANEERLKAEQSLLNDEKLRGYIKNSFKYLASQLVKEPKGLVLISEHDAKFNSHGWETFGKIFCGLCLELNIEAKYSGQYIHIQMDSVKRAFDKMRVEPIDVDERIRAMLHQGPYR